MIKIRFTFFLVCVYAVLHSQTVQAVFPAFDTVLNAGIYKSYMSKRYRLPVAVTYTLHKGGGKASRTNDDFINDTKVPMLTGKDYAGTGYDRGHLVSAEDFAFSDSLQDITFRYYNCVPQTPSLNRGKWRVLETRARKMSETSRIFVVNYMVFPSSPNQYGIYVPTVCYKAVYDLGIGRLMWLVGFENDSDPVDVPASNEIRMICDLLFLNR